MLLSVDDEICLRPISLSDTNVIVRWRNFDAVRLNMQDQRILTVEQHRNYYLSQILSGKIKQYIISKDGVNFGCVYYKRYATYVEIGVFIGEKQYRGKGFAKKALQQLFSIIRNDGINTDYILTVKRTNIRAINLYKHLGFIFYKVLDNRDFILMKKENEI